jgi:hypothetical protein
MIDEVIFFLILHLRMINLEDKYDLNMRFTFGRSTCRTLCEAALNPGVQGYPSLLKTS